MKIVEIKMGREKSIERHHPWVFSGAIASVSAEAQNGDCVDVVSAKGKWLGRGFFSNTSQIAVRLVTFDQNESVDDVFFQNRLQTAWNLRQLRWNDITHTAVRWVHGESDGLPGLVIDRYQNVVSMQIQSAGMARMKAQIVAAIQAIVPECSVYERSDTSMRAKEGLEQEQGILAGDAPAPMTVVKANGIQWAVDIEHGHKTGCYLDQVDNWAAVGECAKGLRVLDTFCYNGGFTLSCLKNEAEHVLAVDSSQDALHRLNENMTLNGFDTSRCEMMCADVFTALRGFRDRRMTFDLIILDPPKFADSKGHVDKACRAYKDINLLAFKLLNPGGMLATFSCSGSVTPELFQKVVADAAHDSGRKAQMVARYTQAPDHPVALAFPEGLYLKGILVRV